MRRSRPSTRTFLLDSNVFIAAIKHPRKQTDTLRLLVKIIGDPEVKLIADELLLEEMKRYAELLKSETAALVLAALISKTELVQVQEKYRKICKTYVDTPNKADVLHAAACLQTDSTLITNDKHFDKLREEGIVEVWSISQTIERFTKRQKSLSRCAR
jgi:predicted nucleic acid-binding protein